MKQVEWKPKHPEASQLWKFMRFVESRQPIVFNNYQELHQWSVKKSALFWQYFCDFFNIHFDTKTHCVLNDYKTMLDARWFEGATFNFAEKLLSRNDDHIALISVDEKGQRQTLTYKALRQQVANCALGLKNVGIGVGDRVAAIMPNNASTIIAMLATTSLGAIWSSCSPDFGSKALFDRFDQIDPTLLFVCDGQIYQGKTHHALEKIRQLSELMPNLKAIVVSPVIDADIKSLPKAIAWNDFLTPAASMEFVSLPFAHPVYILFSSGTTGKPKCMVHGAGGTLLQHIKELGLHTDLTPEDNLCFFTTCGWMMWNWSVSALALGATLTLYDGSPAYPNEGCLFNLIDNEKITIFGTSAKFISSVEQTQIKPRECFSLESLRLILSTGSPLLPQHYDFIYQHVKTDVQLSSISGGSDIISCFALGNPLLPVYRGELQCLGLGMSVEIFNDQGQPIKNERGELVCTKPFPSMPVFFWNDENKKQYHHAYFERFPDVWAHGDFAEITTDHGLIIFGRSDATLNPGGVRIGTAEIYRELTAIPSIIDSVVIGQDWQDDVRVILFVKLKDGITLSEELQQTIRQTIRTNASPRHVPAKIIQVADIPHTINGKTVEIAVRQAIQGEPINNLDSLANPEALEFFKNRVELSH